jgi:hypothetical protein
MSIVFAKAKQCASFFLFVILAPPPPTPADDLQKSQKKELEAAAKALNGEAKSLERGDLRHSGCDDGRANCPRAAAYHVLVENKLCSVGDQRRRRGCLAWKSF